MHQMLLEIAQNVHVDPKIVWAPTSFPKANKVSAWRDMPVCIPGENETFGFHHRDISRAIGAPPFIYRITTQNPASKGILAGARLTPLISTAESGRDGEGQGEASSARRPVRPHRQPVGLSY
jgi:hypothetical protein